MSGGYGSARSGKLKVLAVVEFADTGKKVRTNVFISVYDDALAIVERIERKFDKPLTVLSLRLNHRADKTPLFEAPKKKAA